MKSTEYPYYEDRELFEHSKSLNESRRVFAPSLSETEEDSFEVEESKDKKLRADAKKDKNDIIEMIESKYEKQLADARSDFEKKTKEYQDQLATKDMDVIMLKVQLEDLEQKSEKIIDNVISKTQKHMQGEIKKHKKNHEQKVAKIISDAKEYLKQKNIENENEIVKLKKKIEALTSEAEENKKEKDAEISKLKEEAIKEKDAEISKLKEEAIKEKDLELSRLKMETDKLTLLYHEKIAALESGKEKSDDLIRRLKKNLELKERETSDEQNLKEKISALESEKEKSEDLIRRLKKNLELKEREISDERNLKEKVAALESEKEKSEDLIRRLKKNLELKEREISDDRTLKKKVAALESEKEKSEDLIRRLKKSLELKEREISDERSLKEKVATLESEKEKSEDLIRRLKKNLELKEREISHERSMEEKIIQFKQKLGEQESLLQRKLENRLPPPHSEAKEKAIPKQVAVEIQDILYKERKKYEKLEGELNKNKQMIQELASEKKNLKRELEKSKAFASPTEDVRPKPRVTPFDIISTILLIGANLLFIFVIYPNVPVSYWIESVGLNDLSFIVRILLTMFGIMISLFCFTKAREASSRRGTLKQKKKDGQSLNFLLGVIVIGVALLAIFLLSSGFLFFMTGTLLILLAGLLAVIERKKISS